MKIIDIPDGQRSEAWHQYRKDHFNASDAPAMMGCSPYETRTQLLTRLHAERSGLPTPEVDAGTQRLFDDGHRSEALARPLAEKVLDGDLYPLVMANGTLSASLDGHTLEGTIDWEHKRLNAELRRVVPVLSDPVGGPQVGRALPMNYRVQIAHQHHCSGAAKTLFTASEWDRDGALVDARHCWVERDEALIAQVLAGWQQFAHDLAAFAPAEVVPVVVAAPMEHLPAVSIQTSGALAVQTNLDLFGERLRAFVAKLPKEPETDQEFADLGAACKRLKMAEDAIDQAVNGALASIGDVERMRVLALELRDIARASRLSGEKAVKTRKDEIKVREVRQRQQALAEFVTAANARLGGQYVAAGSIDFGAVIKGLSSLDSVRDKLDTALAQAKIAVTETEHRVYANLTAINGACQPALFADRSQLVHKDPEAVAAIVAQRVAEAKAAEERRLEAERQRIRAEEEDRAARLAEDARVAALKKQREEEAAAESARIAAAAPQPIPEAQPAQQVLKAEPATADATDRGVAVTASPVGGHMGFGQPAAAGPAGGVAVADIRIDLGSLDEEPADVLLADCLAFVRYTKTAFEGKSPSHPKPSDVWWAGLRERIDALESKLVAEESTSG